MNQTVGQNVHQNDQLSSSSSASSSSSLIHHHRAPFTSRSSLAVFSLLFLAPLISDSFGLFVFPLVVCTVTFLLLHPSVVSLIVKFLAPKFSSTTTVTTVAVKSSSSKHQENLLSVDNGLIGAAAAAGGGSDSKAPSQQQPQQPQQQKEVVAATTTTTQEATSSPLFCSLWPSPLIINTWTRFCDNAAHALASHFELCEHQASVVKVTMLIAVYMTFSFVVFCATLVKILSVRM